MVKPIISALVGVVIGSAITFFMVNRNAFLKSKPAAIKYPLKASLFRFTMNEGQEQKFNEWMKWHHTEYPAIIETMEREKMYSEAIFTDSLNQPGVLYWLTIDAEGGAPVNNSPLKIDSVHNQYMKEVLKKGSRMTLKTEFYLIPEFLESAIAEHQFKEK